MLIWMRNSAFAGAFKFILMGLLLMAVGGLVLMDRNGIFRSGNFASHELVKGGGISIGPMEFDRTVRRVLSNQGMGVAEAAKIGAIDTILQSEIQSRLFSKAARDLGLEVGDDMVKAQIAKMAEPLATQGRSKREALQQILSTQNISEQEFISAIRQEMANGALRAALTPPASLISPVLAQSLHRYDAETRNINAIVLMNDSVSDVTKPTSEQLQKYYDANKADFLIPETRTITLATLSPQMVKKNIKISDEDLHNEYDKNIASFTKPPQRRVMQVVSKTEDEAKKALADLKSGKAVTGADTQDYQRDGLLPEIATPVFESKEGSVVGPIQTALGWHVLKIEKLLPESVTPFEKVKDQLRAELESTSMNDEMYQTGNAIEDRAAGGASLAEIVKEYGMTTDIIGPFHQNGNDSDGKDVFKSFGADRDKLIQAAFDYNAGEISPIVETADGQFHLVRVDQVVPDKYKPLSMVSGDLEKRWMDEQRRLSNTARAQKLLDALNAGKKLEDVARENGVTVRPFANISRKSNPPAPLTPVVGAQAFATDIGKNFSSEIKDGFVIGTVTNVSLPAGNPKSDDKDYKDLLDLTGRSLPADILAQYMGGLSDGKTIKINQPMLNQMYLPDSTAK